MRMMYYSVSDTGILGKKKSLREQGVLQHFLVITKVTAKLVFLILNRAATHGHVSAVPVTKVCTLEPSVCLQIFIIEAVGERIIVEIQYQVG